MFSLTHPMSLLHKSCWVKLHALHALLGILFLGISVGCSVPCLIKDNTGLWLYVYLLLCICQNLYYNVCMFIYSEVEYSSKIYTCYLLLKLFTLS